MEQLSNSSLFDSHDKKLANKFDTESQSSVTLTRLQKKHKKLKVANALYMNKGNFFYFIDDCFKHDDIIIPISGKIHRLHEEIKSLDSKRQSSKHNYIVINDKFKEHEQDFVNIQTSSYLGSAKTEKSKKRTYSDCRMSDEFKDTHDNNSELANMAPTDLMLKRWKNHLL